MVFRKKNAWVLFVVVLTAFAAGACGSKDASSIEVSLKSSDLAGNMSALSKGLVQQGGSGIALQNVTGLIDAVFFPFSDQANCGFVVYQANGQSGQIGLAGRSYEFFDLAQAPLWSYQMGDLQCDGGTAGNVSILAAYMDLHLDAGGAQTIRVALGEYGKYRKGDLLIKGGNNVFSWLSQGALVSEQEARPESVRQIESLAGMNYHGDAVLLSMMAAIVDESGQASSVYLSEKVSKIEIDFDLSSSGIAIGDTTSPEGILGSFSMSSLSDFGQGGFSVRVHVTQ